MKKKGLLISIEGTEGVGKSTAATHIANYFRKLQYEVVLTREPGGTEIAEEIRQILLRHHHELLTAETELLLMFASRAQHFSHLIAPALAAGKVVISDRLVDSSYAYQGGGRGVNHSYIELLEQLVCRSINTDLTLLLDAEPHLGAKRVAQLGKPDRIESEQLQFFTRVRDAYLQRAANDPTRFSIIDAEQDLAAVQTAITQSLDKLLMRRNA